MAYYFVFCLRDLFNVYIVFYVCFYNKDEYIFIRS